MEGINGAKAVGTEAGLVITGMKVIGCKPAADGDGTVVTGSKQLLIAGFCDFGIAFAGMVSRSGPAAGQRYDC